MEKKLYKDNKNKMICGVCAGLAKYLNMDATVIRLLYAAALIFTAVAPLVIAYIVAALLIPNEPDCESV